MNADAAWANVLAELRRRLARPGLSAAVIDDLVQQAAFRLVRHVGGSLHDPDRFRDAAQRGAYLRQVARSVWADHFRGIRDVEPLDDVAAPSEPLEPELTDTVAAWLPHFVAQLPEPYRTAVREVDLNGRSQREVAEQLQMSASGLRSRVQRGRRRLHTLIDACCAVTWEAEQIARVTPRGERCACQSSSSSSPTVSISSANASNT